MRFNNQNAVKGVFVGGVLSTFVYHRDLGIIHIDEALTYERSKLYSHPDLQIFYEQQYCESLRHYSQTMRSWKVSQMYYNQGIVGSGKSTEISCQAANHGGKVLVLTQSSAAAKELKCEASTISSYIMHGRIMSDILIVDEATMMHFGEICLAALKCGARKIIMFGDHEQITFKPRIMAERMTLAYHNLPVTAVLVVFLFYFWMPPSQKG